MERALPIKKGTVIENPWGRGWVRSVVFVKLEKIAGNFNFFFEEEVAEPLP